MAVFRTAALCGIALLAGGCESSATERYAPGTNEQLPLAHRLTSGAETVIHSFAGGSDGSVPQAALFAIADTLYGVTTTGGSGSCGNVPGCGTAYEVTTSGAETVLHDFKSGHDGEAPEAPFTEAGGNLFGTTVRGGGAGCQVVVGVRGCGTIFEMTPSGVETVLYRFPGKAKGALPQAPLTKLKREFFGEAQAGGTGTCRYASPAGCGVIFEMSESGHVTVTYSFKGGKDGRAPQGGLVALHGVLYGATGGGGSYACSFDDGCGTVFKITPSGSETVLHAFKRAHDGAVPQGGLAVLNGELYGSTFSGGKFNCAFSGSGYGCGTVYEVALTGREKVLHNFTGLDGAFPNQPLAVNGNLYGTTEGKGAYQCGTVFRLSPSGELTTLYNFKGGSDGCGPNSALIELGGTLYGTTTAGGTYNLGTVFAIPYS